MKALVLYHSLFGNTKTVAMSLTRGLQNSGVETDCLNIEEVNISTISDYDFLTIGSPTHMIRPSKEMKEFLERLKTLDLKGLRGFSFDTRNESKMNQRKWSIFENSAARTIERWMKKRGIEIIRSRESAIVEGREGPLDAGVEVTFEKIGTEIGNLLVSIPVKI
ncbi:MAG: flavodoxin family protein [Candidatus Thorarchaeota archaeon]